MKPSNVSLVFFFFVFTSLITACQSKPVAPKVENALVLAEIGDKKVLSTDFIKQIERIQERTPQVPSTHLQKKELLEQWINVDLLYEEALREGFDSRFEFRSKLAEAYIEDLAEKARASITESELYDHYSKNKKSYDQVAVRHILLQTKPGISEKEKISIFQRLEKMREELLKDPELFDDYARRYSEDSTNRQGGDLGYFTYDQMVPSFSKAAFDLKVINDISPVISTQFGYHLIQLRADRRGIEHHASQIRELIVRKVQRDILEKEIERLRGKTPIKIYEEELLTLSPLPEVITTDPEKLLPPKLPIETRESKEESSE